MCVDKSTSVTCISDDYRIDGAWDQYYVIDLPHDHVTSADFCSYETTKINIEYLLLYFYDF